MRPHLHLDELVELTVITTDTVMVLVADTEAGVYTATIQTSDN